MDLELRGYTRIAGCCERHSWREFDGSLLGNVKGRMELDYQRGSDKLGDDGSLPFSGTDPRAISGPH